MGLVKKSYKKPEKLLKIDTIKKFNFFCVCIKWTNLLYSLQKHGKNDAEVREYGGEIWINQKHLEKKLDILNIADRIQYNPSEF